MMQSSKQETTKFKGTEQDGVRQVLLNCGKLERLAKTTIFVKGQAGISKIRQTNKQKTCY